MALQYFFKEEDSQTYFMDYRVFIDGEEITDWISGGISWSLTGTDGINSISFTLENPENIWILTEENLSKSSPVWRKTNDLLNEGPKYRLWARKNARNEYDKKTNQYIYPLYPQTTIFHTHDCIRLFARCPFTNEDWWMPAFTGFLEKHPFSDDYLTGGHPLNLSAYCLKGILKRMRVNINPLAPAMQNTTQQDIQSTINTQAQFMSRDGLMDGRTGYFADLHFAQGMNHVLAGRDFETAIDILLRGVGGVTIPTQQKTINLYNGLAQTTITSKKTANEEEESPNAAQMLPAYQKGQVGRIRKGLVRTYPKDSLEKWHNLCLFGWEDGRYLTYDEVTKIGKATRGDNVCFSPYNMFYHLLLPDDGTAAKTMALLNLDSLPDMEQGANFQTRYDLINEAVRNLDYQWYTSPIGDLIFEFPMFDFNKKPFKSYKNVFVADKHLTTDSIEDEANDLPTAMVVTGSETTAQEQEIRDGVHRSQDIARHVVYSPILASRLGANVEVISAPVGVGAGSMAANSIDGWKGGARGLESWALLQFQKRVGEASTMSFPLPWRPLLLPNRPLENKARDRIGLIRSIEHQLTEGQAATTVVQIAYVRTLDTDFKYRYITGGENEPINYSTQFTDSGCKEYSAILVSQGPGKGTSQGQLPEKRILKNNRVTQCSNKRTVRILTVMPWVKEASQKTGIEEELILGIISVESSFVNAKPNSVGATGYMQLMAAFKERKGGQWTGKYVKSGFLLQAERNAGIVSGSKMVDLKGAKQAAEPLRNGRLNILMGTKHVKSYIERYNDVEWGISAYNWGPRNVDMHVKRYKQGLISNKLPTVNEHYVRKVMSAWAWFKRNKNKLATCG